MTAHHNEEVAVRQHNWETEVVEPLLQRYPERQAQFNTTSDIDLKRVYTPVDHDSSAYLEQLGFPGQFPYTRGVYPTMYRGRPWTMRQYAGLRHGGGVERALQIPVRARAKGPQRGL